MKTFHRLIRKSIGSKIYRSIGLVLIGVILSYALVFVSLVSVGMEHGTKNVANRMGADLIVVPKGSGKDLERLLLTAKKNYFYMDESVLDKIVNTKGVAKVSPQTFLMTMEASCCDQSVEIIGVDMDSDFTITPWIDNKYLKSIENGEVIVGSKVDIREDRTFKMFGKVFKVASVLEESGTSMDETVFVSRNKMDEIMTLAKAAGQGMIKDVTQKDISAVLVKVKDGVDLQRITATLAEIEGVDIVSKDTVSEKLTGSLKDMYIPCIIFSVTIIIVTVLLLYIIYFIIIRDRKKEIEVLRIIGISRKDVKSILRNEIIFISVVGSAIGTLFGTISFFVMFELIDNVSNVPFTYPSLQESVLIIAIVFILTAGLGPVCSTVSIRKICPKEILE